DGRKHAPPQIREHGVSLLHIQIGNRRIGNVHLLRQERGNALGIFKRLLLEHHLESRLKLRSLAVAGWLVAVIEYGLKELRADPIARTLATMAVLVSWLELHQRYSPTSRLAIKYAS